MGYDVFENLCKKKGVRPYHVSLETGVSTATISSWKTGRYTPKTEKLQKLADYFGVTVDYLLTGEAPEQESSSGKKYYFSDETAEVAQELFDDPDLRVLFDSARDSRPEDLRLAADMLRRLKETNIDG